MDLCNSPEIVRAVVPTLAIPFAAIAFFFNALAGWIASLFGHSSLHWDRPRQLLKTLLRPRVLIIAVVFNAAVWGAVRAYSYWRTYPERLSKIERVNRELLAAAGPVGVRRTYTDHPTRLNEYDAPSGGGKIESVAFKQIWRAKAGSGGLGAAVVSGNSVFVGSSDGYIYEFNEADGHIVRKFYVGTGTWAEPAIWKDRLFIGEGSHDIHGARLYAFDLKSGAFVGAVETSGHTESSPLVVHDPATGRDSLLFTSGKDGVYSIDPRTLKQNWHFVGGHTDGEPRVRDGRVYFSTGIEKGLKDNRRLAYALDLNSGAKVWEAALPASGWMPGMFVDNQICFAVGEIYMESNFGQISCYDQMTGAPGHAVTLDAPLALLTSRIGNEIVVADLEGEVCAVKLPEWTRRWCRPMHNKWGAPPALLEPGIVLYPTERDGLIAFDLETGRMVGTWMPTAAEGLWKGTSSRTTAGRFASEFFLPDSSGNLRKLSAEVK